MFVGGLNRRRPLRFTFLPLALESLPVGDPGTFLFHCVTADAFGTRSAGLSSELFPSLARLELNVTANLCPRFSAPPRCGIVAAGIFGRSIQVAASRLPEMRRNVALL